MVKEIQISVTPEEAYNEDFIKQAAALKEQISPSEITDLEILKRSIDARQRQIQYILTLKIFINEKRKIEAYTPSYQNVAAAKEEIVIIGAGPAGLFAALRAIELGIKPIVFERGKNVKDRRRDLAAINKEGIVNPESNYCFGEGGAGTYSDGKLYTRSKKRGSVEKVLDTLVFHGANPNIKVDAHPHIGTNKLPDLVTNIREAIQNFGGTVEFNSKLTDIIIEGNAVSGVVINGNKTISCSKLIIATGHSARDIFELLHSKKIELEFKPFALGVRIEHPQKVIDSIQYRCEDRGEYLPPASYNLVTQAGNRGVYSFCMCPGGIIAPCATSPGEVVTNGWSPSKRNNPFSNSGIVTEVRWDDISEFHKYGPLAGMYFQKSVEQKCWEMAGKTQKVPAQRMVDFIQKKKSVTLPETSYHPGIESIEMDKVLPEFVVKALRAGLSDFGKRMKGYQTNDAVLHATESRTSSPVRIPRDKETMEHTKIKGLYPCGEGAGYAGGIVSAAIDGQNVVDAINARI